MLEGAFNLDWLDRGSQPFSCHVPLQHSHRWAWNRSVCQKISMYPFSIL